MVAGYCRQNKDHSACLNGSWTSLLDTLACWNLPLNLHYACVMYKYMAILHCIVVSAVHDKKYLLLVLYSLDSYRKWLGYSAVVSLAGGTQQNTTCLQKPLRSKGHTNSDYVHILHAILVATTQNQTGPPPQNAQKNPLPYHRVSQRKSQCTWRYTRISLLVAWESFAIFTVVR